MAKRSEIDDRRRRNEGRQARRRGRPPLVTRSHGRAPVTARTVGAVGLLLAVAAASVLLGLAPSGSSETQPPTWTQVDGPSPFPAPPGTFRPSARRLPALAYDARHGDVVLFGGKAAGGGVLDDTWIWDGSAWTQPPIPPSSRPPAREGATMAFDGRHVVLFGGDDIGHPVPGDTWLWDGDSLTWSRATVAPGPAPGARTLASMAYDEAKGTVVLFGGLEFPSTLLAETWTWNGATSSWAQVAGGPPSRSGGAMAYDPDPADPAHPYLLLFGGFGAAGNLADTWTWDGSWARQPDSPPTVLADGSSMALKGRNDAAMAFDAVTGKVAMFGGSGDGHTPKPGDPDCVPLSYDANVCATIAEVDETWSWGGPGGKGWHYEDPFLMAKSGVPPSRFGGVMAAQPGAVPRTVMLFGGFGGGAELGDTWTWDGTSPPETTTTTSASTSTSTSTSTTSVPGPAAAVLPSIRGLDPPSGSTSGGTAVSIHGAGFTGATAAFFGDQRLDCTQPGVCQVSDDGHLRVTSPAHARGTVDVRVATATGTSAVVRDPTTGDDEFTFFPAGPGAPSNTFGPGSGGFSPGPPVQPAPPGGFGSVPVPGAGFSPVPGPGAAPAPGTPTAPAAGVVPPAPATAAAPGLVPPAAAPPPVAAPGAPGDPTWAPGAATHFTMVRRTWPDGGSRAGAPAGVAGGALLVVGCCFWCASRQPRRGQPQVQRA